MLARQGGRCAICERSPGILRVALRVDHDHATGRVRGLLCDSCNAALGLFGDETARLERAIEYLHVFGAA